MRIDQIGANSSCLANVPLHDAIDRIHALGFRGITLLAYDGARHRYGDLAGFWFRDMDDTRRRELRAHLRGFERLALHAPFADLPLFSYDPKVAQLARDRVEESVDAAGYLGARVVIVHANPRPYMAVGEYWDEMVDIFRGLGRYAVDRGVRIGVETGYPDQIEQFADLLEAVGHHGVGATLDVGHTVRYVDRAMWGTPLGVQLLNDRLADLARQLGPMVIHCHLHDVRASDWRDHVAVGRGVLNFPRILSELRTIGYEGTLELELEQPDQEVALVESKHRLETSIRDLARGRPEVYRPAA